VVSRTLTVAPTSGITAGDLYVVAATPLSGDPWFGQSGKLAEWVGPGYAATDWTFTTLTQGSLYWIDAESKLLGYNGSTLVTVNAAAGAGIAAYVFTQSSALVGNLTTLSSTGQLVTAAFAGTAQGAFTLNPAIASGLITPELGFYEVQCSGNLLYVLNATGNTVDISLSVDVAGTADFIYSNYSTWRDANQGGSAVITLPTFTYQFDGIKSLQLRFVSTAASAIFASCSIDTCRIELRKFG
jgi:hypothetical protein